MDNIDDTQIKAEIDGIMKGVKDIMKKIDALTPKEQTEQSPVEDQGESPDPTNRTAARQE